MYCLQDRGCDHWQFDSWDKLFGPLIAPLQDSLQIENAGKVDNVTERTGVIFPLYVRVC